MKRHPFDPISAFFGTLIGGSALAVTLADDRVFDLNGQWVWPALIILTGLVLLFSGLGRAGSGSD